MPHANQKTRLKSGRRGQSNALDALAKLKRARNAQQGGTRSSVLQDRTKPKRGNLGSRQDQAEADQRQGVSTLRADRGNRAEAPQTARRSGRKGDIPRETLQRSQRDVRQLRNSSVQDRLRSARKPAQQSRTLRRKKA